MSSNNTRDLSGKHFVFFGGTSGIGLSAAETLAKDGARIAVMGRSKGPGQAAVDRLLAAGAQEAVFLEGDLLTVKGAQAAATKARQWSPKLDGIVHSALSPFSEKIITEDGLELCYAMQYQNRAIIDSLLLESLSASGDGRIVHMAGPAPALMMPDLDDLQFEKRSWGFWKSLLGSHNLFFLFIQQASQKWKDHPISIAANCVGPTKTPGAVDPKMPLLMRLSDYFAVTPEVSAQNIVNYMKWAKVEEKDRFGIFWSSKKPVLAKPSLSAEKAEKLWVYTKKVAEDRGVTLDAI